MYTMEYYYSEIKKNEIMSLFAATWIKGLGGIRNVQEGIYE